MEDNTIIKIEKLTKAYNVNKDNIVALRDINLEISRGEIFGVIGLSGAGKSTLVRIMNLLERPTEGKVFFEDKNLEQLNNSELRKVRKEIGMIFQNFNLLEQRTVLKNVSFPLELINMPKDKREEKALELLKLVDLEEKAKAYPSQLSGGQKQRVAIARALATNPKVILCDEATSALDPNTTKQILDLLKKINKEMNVTIVVITHQMSVIEDICDRVAIIDHSKIAEIGNVKDVFRNPKSEIGKKLIFGNYVDVLKNLKVNSKGPLLRITFDGTQTNEPVISNMILKSGAQVNILFGNVKSVDNIMVGELIVELPEDNDKSDNIKQYLKEQNITFWEVEKDD